MTDLPPEMNISTHEDHAVCNKCCWGTASPHFNLPNEPHLKLSRKWAYHQMLGCVQLVLLRRHASPPQLAECVNWMAFFCAAAAVEEPYPPTSKLLEKLQEVLEKADVEVTLLFLLTSCILCHRCICSLWQCLYITLSIIQVSLTRQIGK